MQTLNDYVAERRRGLYDELQSGKAPSAGQFDVDRLREARDHGKPQLGAVRFAPNSIVYEFIYPKSQGSTLLLEVSEVPPERIVWLPVPAWVVEQIWEGEVTGSYRFQSHAEDAVREFAALLEEGPNGSIFGVREPKRRG